MDCYQEMYYILFGKVTDVIGELQKAQQETEETFLSHNKEKSDNILHITRKGEGEDDSEKPPKK